MYKLIIKSAETGAVLLSGTGNDENISEHADEWLKENGFLPDKVVVEINEIMGPSGNSIQEIKT